MKKWVVSSEGKLLLEIKTGPFGFNLYDEKYKYPLGFGIANWREISDAEAQRHYDYKKLKHLWNRW